MSANRPICVLVGALGGQGGRLLADWMVEAAAISGYPAQATSIAGVAQRTGATTYYFELFPEREAPAPPVFSLFPDAGEVDLMAALEPTEAARAMSRGFITRDTVVISSLDRLYSTAEKVDQGDGRVDLARIVEALAHGCRKILPFSPPPESDGQLNAMMFGAIAASRVLPLSDDDCRRAIEARGVAVESNLRGFDAGLDLAANAQRTARADPGKTYASAPAGFEADVAHCPEALRPIVGHSIARLVEYQDRSYAEKYLARLGQVIEADAGAGGETAGWRLSRIVAERMGAWMSYEDVARVAQLKTRPGRLARIRAEVAAAPGEPVEVIDYLKPTREEFISIVPAHADWLVPRVFTRGIPLRLRTSSPWGWATLKMLAAMRRIRPRTRRFAQEQDAIEAWLAATVMAARKDYRLALRTAELAIWARGYGQVRARGLTAISEILNDWPQRLQRDWDQLNADLERSLYRARHDPEAACRPAP
jgi:indolepyruvate ferredoxin oxidoreductase beta subunit